MAQLYRRSDQRTAKQRLGQRRFGAGPQATPAMEWEPCAWEKLLTDLQVRESAALREIRGRTEKGERLRNWVTENAHRLFVPERVLRELRMTAHVERSTEDGHAPFRRGAALHMHRLAEARA